MAGQGGYNISILYEDNHIICAVKPRGILSQADETGAPDMLTILKRYIKEKHKKPGEVYLVLVHRLDRPVGGVMVFARTSKAAGRLSAQIRERGVDKIYYAVLYGRPQSASGLLEHRIRKDRASNLVQVSDYTRGQNILQGPYHAQAQNILQAPDHARALDHTQAHVRASDHAQATDIGRYNDKEYAALEYMIVAAEEREKLSLVSVKLLTGRPHQIRAQFAYIGHPVAGDRKYGGKQATGVIANMPGPALWAASLEFLHPVKQSPLKVSAPPPDEYPWNLFNGIDYGSSPQ